MVWVCKELGVMVCLRPVMVGIGIHELRPHCGRAFAKISAGFGLQGSNLGRV